MKRNVFLKSIIRQPIQTMALMLLITIAAFLIVMYGLEYISMKDKVEKVSSYYPSIGFLTIEGSNGVNRNVIDGVTIVKNSQYVVEEDERRGVQGMLQGMTNTNFYGMTPPPLDEFFRVVDGKIYSQHHTDTVFIGRVLSIDTGNERWTSASPPFVMRLEQPYIQLSVYADTVLCGYPEHIVEEQIVKLRYYLTSTEVDEYLSMNEAFESVIASYPSTPVDSIAIGDRYIFRGAYCSQSHYVQSAPLKHKPEIGNDRDPLFMIPINTITDGVNRTRTLVNAPLWYVQVGTDDAFDASSPSLEEISAELERLRLSQSAVQLRTTSDMTMIPSTQAEVNQITLFDGRMIGSDDEIDENHVTVIHKSFADDRGLAIGDTLTVRIPQNQYITGVDGITDGKVYVPNDLSLACAPQSSYDYELDLVIVGLYRYSNWSGPDSPVGGFETTYFFSIIYIPDSILRHDYTLELSPRLIANGLQLDDTYLPEVWYSFVLNDARSKRAFLEENQDDLAELGLTAGFVQNNADFFWESAEPILQNVLLNVFMFCAASIVMLFFVVFFFQRLRRKDMAIMRAIGIPPKAVAFKAVSAIALCGLPMTMIGGLCAWFYMSGRTDTVTWVDNESLQELWHSIGITVSILWVVLLIAVSYVIFLFIASLSSWAKSRQPIISMLIISAK